MIENYHDRKVLIVVKIQSYLDTMLYLSAFSGFTILDRHKQNKFSVTHTR